MSYTRILYCILPSLFILSCGGSDQTKKSELPSGFFNLSISDSPMTGVNSVKMSINEMIMLDSQGEEHRHVIQNTMFDLMEYQGSASYMLLDQLALPAGEYHDVQLMVGIDSIVDSMMGQYNLMIQGQYIPVENIIISANQITSMTVEVDLYRSMIEGNDGYELTHSGISTVNNLQMGQLVAEMNSQWIADCESEHANLAAEGNTFQHMAYFYEAQDLTIEQLGDANINLAEGVFSPVAMQLLELDDDNNWHFTMGFLNEGDYTVGFTCLGHLDNPQLNDSQQGEFIMFRLGGNVNIQSGMNGEQLNEHKIGNGHDHSGSGMHGS